MGLPVVAVVAGATLAGVVGYGVYLWSSRREGEGLPSAQLPGQIPGQTPPKDTPTPTDIAELDIEDFIGVFPNGGFHETQLGNSISSMASGVLNRIDPGAGNEPAMVRAYKKILNSSDWNRELYGVYEPNVADAFEGFHIQRAFLPHHEDAANVMRAGFRPVRFISDKGVVRAGSPRKWGDPWAVRLNPAAVKARITDPRILIAPNPDGSSGLNPPPALVNKLTVRP